jgi:hypothetical protein
MKAYAKHELYTKALVPNNDLYIKTSMLAKNDKKCNDGIGYKLFGIELRENNGNKGILLGCERNFFNKFEW